MVLAWLSLAGPAWADDEAYTLGEYDIDVTMPKGWEGIRYSDKDFRAQTDDQAVQAMIWGSTFQVTPQAADADQWSAYYEKQAVGLQAHAPKVHVAVGAHGSDPMETAEVDFHIGGDKGPPGRMFVASFPVAGHMVHLATLSAASAGPRAKKGLDTFLKSITTKKPVPKLEDGPVVEVRGIKTDLPAGWRAALPEEQGPLSERLSLLSLPDSSTCFFAIAPRGPVDPDVMAACGTGVFLGVVDALSFEGVELDLRHLLFKEAPVQPAMRLDLADRVGFQYHLPLPNNSLDLAVVPYDQGIARFWILGPQEDGTRLQAALRDAVLATTFSGPHPATIDQEVSYYVSYRPFSLPVLGTVGGLLCLGAAVIGGVGAVMTMGRRKRPEPQY